MSENPLSYFMTGTIKNKKMQFFNYNMHSVELLTQWDLQGMVSLTKRRERRRKGKGIIVHSVLPLVVFGSTVQRVEQNLLKQGLCVYHHFAP